MKNSFNLGIDKHIYIINYNEATDGELVYEFIRSSRLKFVDEEFVNLGLAENEAFTVWSLLNLDIKEVNEFSLDAFDPETLAVIKLFVNKVRHSGEYKCRSSIHEEEDIMKSCGSVIIERSTKLQKDKLLAMKDGLRFASYFEEPDYLYNHDEFIKKEKRTLTSKIK